ncbi:hypothetical protein C8R44DRAFT_382716 [Mycena epipterygia]|nr:hypothetical protein C8R44DRAFT_382716 [Mycena epipterygia]
MRMCTRRLCHVPVSCLMPASGPQPDGFPAFNPPPRNVSPPSMLGLMFPPQQTSPPQTLASTSASQTPH